mgnify:CR=1 FL=1
MNYPTFEVDKNLYKNLSQSFFIINLSNLTEFCPTTIPFFEKFLLGIKSIFLGLLSNKQIQAKKSIGLFLLRLKTHTPACSDLTGFFLLNFLFHKLQVFTSILVPFKSKSAPLELNNKCLAPKNLAMNFSHFKPFPVSQFQNLGSFLKYEFELVFLIYQALFIHLLEQYFGREVFKLHIKQFII